MESLYPRDVVTDPLYYTMDAGRNRFRAVLPLLIAELADFDPDKALIMGCVAEMSWSAIIVHDDIIDHDIVRRGQTAAHCHFSLSSALCSGEIGMLDGVGILATHGLSDKIVPYCDAIRSTYAGQLLHQYIAIHSQEHELLNVYRLKAAIGDWPIKGVAIASELHWVPRFCEVLAEAGQIKDDLDDLFCDDKYEISFRDLNEGTYSFVWLMFFARADQDDIMFINTYFGKKASERAPREEIIRKLEKYDIVRTLESYIDARVKTALSLLKNLPINDAKEVLTLWATSHTAARYEG